MVDLIEIYNKDPLFRLVAKPIMVSHPDRPRSRLRYKRDSLRNSLRNVNLIISFEMKDLRELHYYLNPSDKKRYTYV